MKNLHPAAVPLFDQGEAAWKAGEVAKAAELYHQASDAASSSALAARRWCQALTELGQANDAILACERAIKIQSSSALNSRAMVGALMSEKPTPAEVARAVLLADQADGLMPDQPWGLAARCDIAERMGDIDMLTSCVQQLERYMPGHYETQRFAAALRAHATPRHVWIGWLALLAVVMGTLGHAVYRGLRGVRQRLVAPLVVLLLSALSAAPAGAQGLSKWKVDDDDPVGSVPPPEKRDRDPLNYGYHLMDLADRADLAVKERDYAKAAKYYEAIVKAVPNVALGYRKACEYWELANERDSAIPYCKGALAVNGAELQDHARLARLVLSKQGNLTAEETEDLSEIVKHLRAEKAGAQLALDIECDLGMRIEDVARLESCSTALAKSAPDDPKTLTFQWALAMKREQFDEAKALLDRARPTAINPERLQQMEAITARESSLWTRLSLHWPTAAAIAGLAALALLAQLVVHALRRRSRVQPAAAPMQTEP